MKLVQIVDADSCWLDVSSVGVAACLLASVATCHTASVYTDTRPERLSLPDEPFICFLHHVPTETTSRLTSQPRRRSANTAEHCAEIVWCTKIQKVGMKQNIIWTLLVSQKDVFNVFRLSSVFFFLTAESTPRDTGVSFWREP